MGLWVPRPSSKSPIESSLYLSLVDSLSDASTNPQTPEFQFPCLRSRARRVNLFVANPKNRARPMSAPIGRSHAQWPLIITRTNATMPPSGYFS